MATDAREELENTREPLEKSGESELEDKAREDPAPKKGPKRTPIFARGPARPSKYYVRSRDMFGNEAPSQEAESPEAASHWDARYWRLL